MNQAPGTGDSGDRAQFLKLFTWLAIPGYFLLAAGEAVARGRDWIGTATFLLLLRKSHGHLRVGKRVVERQTILRAVIDCAF